MPKAITRKSKEEAYQINTLSDALLDMIGLRKPLNFIFSSQETNYSRRQIQKSLQYLKRKEFAAFSAEKDKHPVLTKLGWRRLNKLKFQQLKVKPAPWDGKWRVVTFDIPMRQHQLRHTFRRKLKELGFFHFQRSVFILPYECEKEISMIANYLKIRPGVHLLVAERFPGDAKIVKKFDLT